MLDLSFLDIKEKFLTTSSFYVYALHTKCRGIIRYVNQPNFASDNWCWSCHELVKIEDLTER